MKAAGASNGRPRDMRARELRGLRWPDVDLDAGFVRIRQRADKWGTIGLPKSKKGNLDVIYWFWIPLQVKCGLVGDQGNHKYGHMLRHAACSLFIAYLGWTPKKISTVMGHSSIAITFNRYGHLFENKGADMEAMQKLEAAVSAA
jgi:integrase